MDEIIAKIKSETDPFSKAKYIRYLLREKNFRVIDLADRLSMTPSYICHLNRLNNLPEMIVDGYYSKLVNISQLFLISLVKDKTKLTGIYEKILAGGLTLKQTEELIREELYQVKTKGSFIGNRDKDKIYDDLKKAFPGVSLKITQTRTRSRLDLEIFGDLEKTSKEVRNIMQKLLR